MQAFKSLGDIEQLERTPLAQTAPHRSPYALIRAAAERFPEREAFTFLPDAALETPPQHTTYRDLLANIHRAANLFRSLGVGADDAVALLVPNIPEAHAVLWGAQLAGRVCPINYLLQPEHIASLLKASKAKLLVALGPNRELAVWPVAEQVVRHHALPLLQIRVGEETAPDAPVLQALLAAQPDTLGFEPDLNPDRVVALFHTGGTTGAPKLAQHTQGNEAHTAWFAHAFYGADEHAVEINGFPLFHVAGAFVYGLALLAVGARQVLPTLTGMRNAGFVQHYWRFCERERATHLACVPTVLAALMGVPVNADITTVRAAFTGGSPLPTELAQRFEAATGIAVRNILGMTECAGLVGIEPLNGPRTPGSAGLRLPYTDVHAVPWRGGEAKLGERCAVGETGVLVLRGPHVSPGYTERARNAGLFEQGWIVTGDLGHLDADGRIHVTGRSKDVIIRGSHNIDPGLVEDAFLAHPAVALCAVVAEPDAYAGEVPVAFVTLKPGAAIGAEDLLAAVAPQVYERPACPKRVVVLDALPVTAIGKVFKPELRLRAIEIKLGESAREWAPGVSAQVQALEKNGQQCAVITVQGAPDEALREKLMQGLAAMAVHTELRFV
ncbi:AMP-binding protein [Hydrogenophaga sp. BPS33]|uniref:AMP-binding protein n=1 Tax=Hydrogenophaga sp. BPS33 TaxID=2651974 RepID=UPI00132045A4|nr:AMP-binding protein [Hydrogenophaga sp. BPS33]QHE85595.1 AMP-binding protein [Hydrogenophaga sp. BPS33]